MKTTLLFLGVLFSLSANSQNFSRALTEETNFLRTRPQEYSRMMETWLKTQGFPSEREIFYRELKPRLEKMQPLKPLIYLDTLEKYLAFHKVDTLSMYVPHEFKWAKFSFSVINENIFISSTDEVRDIVIRFLIDEFVTGRGHRENLLDPTVTHTVVLKICFREPTNKLCRRIAVIQELISF